ncbi:MAG TPA: hypothetical protein VHS81_03665, partial [Caulobacteraceae bacterium]|nr:hypothetical protein [Caulobacteraceae bacterium]
LLPAYAANFLSWSVISRPLQGEAPTIDVMLGYHRANSSPILKSLLRRLDDLLGPDGRPQTTGGPTDSVTGAVRLTPP